MPGSISRVAVVLLAALVIASSVARSGVAVSEIGQRFATFEAEAQSAGLPSRSTPLRVIGASYSTWFAPYLTEQRLRTTSNDDLGLLFRAANDAFGVTEDPTYVGDMKRTLTEMSERKIAYRADFLDMERAFVESRDFEEASTIEREYPDPDAPMLPRLACDERRPHDPLYLEVRDDARTIICRAATLTSKAQIIVVASPHCHFCKRAIPAIEADSELRAAFEGRTIWLVPQADTGFSDVARWNETNPRAAMVCVYRQIAWPMISSWDTPSFYFLKRGRVVATVRGWPLPGGNKRAIVSGLRRIGIATL